MTEPYLGQIYLVAFDFAPRGFALCAGQTLPINQNQALFALLGTTYGGNGTTTFALPNLLSRVPIHFGTGPVGDSYQLGQVAGTENVTLLSSQMPVHTHAWSANSAAANANSPGGNKLAQSTAAIYSAATNLTGLNPGVVGPAGSSQPHSNIMPYQAINYVIALQGIFPSRN